MADDDTLRFDRIISLSLVSNLISSAATEEVIVQSKFLDMNDIFDPLFLS